MKTRKPHRVPLSPRAVAILQGSARPASPRSSFRARDQTDRLMTTPMCAGAAPARRAAHRAWFPLIVTHVGGRGWRFRARDLPRQRWRMRSSRVDPASLSKRTTFFDQRRRLMGEMGRRIAQGKATRGDGRRGGGDARCPPWLAGPNTPMRCCWIGRAGA